MTDIVDELRARALQGRFNLEAADEIERLRAELSEQCRLLGMSGEREAKHLAQIAALEKERDALRAELDALKAWKEEAEKQEPVAWRTFDGEGGYDYRGVDDNEDYRDEFIERNPRYANWVDALYLHPVPPAHSVPVAQPVPARRVRKS
jgi:septal ring factor EnvC (AmiA/AmiB activator)